MGNGQCPECYGTPESWLGHPCHLTPKTLGHKVDCSLAKAMSDVGLKPLYLGQSKLTEEYESYITEHGFCSTRPKTKNGCPILNKKNEEFKKKLQQVMDDIFIKAISMASDHQP